MLDVVLNEQIIARKHTITEQNINDIRTLIYSEYSLETYRISIDLLVPDQMLTIFINLKNEQMLQFIYFREQLDMGIRQAGEIVATWVNNQVKIQNFLAPKIINIIKNEDKR